MALSFLASSGKEGDNIVLEKPTGKGNQLFEFLKAK
jgi:hypothetical protein